MNSQALEIAEKSTKIPKKDESNKDSKPSLKSNSTEHRRTSKTSVDSTKPKFDNSRLSASSKSKYEVKRDMTVKLLVGRVE